MARGRSPASDSGGFTLIELLVVIAIIALLMSILMPALGRVRKQARAVACRGNVKQWGLIFSMYSDYNNGKFLPGNHHNNHVNQWHRNFKTGNEWTSRGGVTHGDWPPWMRNLKDY